MERKRNKTGVEQEEEEESLLSGLPDHLAQVILSGVNNPYLLYSVCRSWRKLVYSPSFPPFLSLYALLSDSSSCSSVELVCFDPISGRWSDIPPPPHDPNLFPPLVFRHPSFIARSLPVQSVSVSDHLVLLAATTHHLLPALSHPLIFNPLDKSWDLGPSISAPRRWCAAGALGNAVYLVSGVGSAGYTQDVARSAEKWVVLNNRWDKVAPLKHGRFSREAVEGVGWRGKLCVVNVRGNVVKEGVLYDQEDDTWRDMPPGMLIGWNGPAASMDEEVIYSVDQDKGVLMRYSSDADAWEVVVETPELFRGAAQIVACGGRVCVVGGGGMEVVVVDVVAQPPRIVCVLEPPQPHMNFVAVHVLPRMTSDSHR